MLFINTTKVSANPFSRLFSRIRGATSSLSLTNLSTKSKSVNLNNPLSNGPKSSKISRSGSLSDLFGDNNNNVILKKVKMGSGKNRTIIPPVPPVPTFETKNSSDNSKSSSSNSSNGITTGINKSTGTKSSNGLKTSSSSGSKIIASSYL